MIHIDFSNLPILENQQILDETALRQTGKTSGMFTFVEGDILEFPPKVTAFNDQFVRKDGSQTDCFKTVVGYNGKAKAIPLSALFRVPFQQLESWLNDHEVNREIYNAGDNFERLKLLSGKVLKVSKVVKGPKATFDETGKIKKDANGNYVTKDSLYPVFEYYVG